MLPLSFITRVFYPGRRWFCELKLKDTNLVVGNMGEFVISEGKRTLKVAILGAPNAGKSTLINRLVGMPVLCVSKKVHTTRIRQRVALVRGNVQILFVDTPGLVSRAEIKRFQLEPSFRSNVISAISEAHMIGVVHDASNVWTRHRFEKNVVEILSSVASKEVFLILNKVDAIESKKKLLDLVQKLTLSAPGEREINISRPDQLEMNTCTDKKPPTRGTWSNFSEVFMVSALKGDGVQDLSDYLVARAEEGRWFLPPGKVTDRPWPVVLQEMVRGRLLDALPQEVPYLLKIETEYFHINDLGEVISVVLVTCPILRHQKILLSGSGSTIRRVAKLAEEDARDALRTHVRLRIVVTTSEPKPSKERI